MMFAFLNGLVNVDFTKISGFIPNSVARVIVLPVS